MPLQIFSAGSGIHPLRHYENPHGPYPCRGLPAFASLSMAGSVRALKKGQARPWRYQEGIMGEVRLIERNFGLAAV